MKLAVLAFLTIPALLTGCLGLLPVPSHSKVEEGRVIEARETQFIVAGRTSRAQVIERLGQDFRASPRLPVLAYSWEITRGMTVWWWCSPSAAGGGESEWSNWRAYFVAFDGEGVVTQAKFVHLSSGKSLDDQLEDWGRKVESKRQAALRRQGRSEQVGLRGNANLRQHDTVSSALSEGPAFVEPRQGAHAVNQVSH